MAPATRVALRGLATTSLDGFVSLVPSLIALGWIVNLRVFDDKSVSPRSAVIMVTQATLAVLILNMFLLEEDNIDATVKTIGLPLKVACMLGPVWSSERERRNDRILQVVLGIVAVEVLKKILLPAKLGTYLELLLPDLGDLLGVMFWGGAVLGFVVFYTQLSKRVKTDKLLRRKEERKLRQKY